MKTRFLLSTLLLILVFSCRDDDGDGTTPIELDETPYELNYGNFPNPNLPEDNPLTVAGVHLGKMLFYEKMLSVDNSVACASCHLQENAFTDPSQFSLGVNDAEGDRHAMTIFNMAWHHNGFFWDGRAHTLRSQSLMPIQSEVELNETLINVIQKLSQETEYVDQFIRAFGSPAITSSKLGLAMEQFMMTIVSNHSKYDRFLAGEVEFTEAEQRGFDLFFQDYNPFFPEDSGADCAHCHGGFNFTNDMYLNNGLDLEADFSDLGFFHVTESNSDLAKFKVPSLRNITLSAPYMHDGRFETLEEVIAHYNSGVQPSSTLEVTLENTIETGLFLDEQEISDLLAFLKTLEDQTLVSNPEFSSPF